MLDDVAAGGVAARVAEPLAGLHTAHDARRVVNATEAARPFGGLHVCGVPRGGGEGCVLICWLPQSFDH